MKTSRMLTSACALFVAGAVGFAAAESFHQDPTMAKPTKEHEWLAKHRGKWDAKMGGMMGESSGTNLIEAGPGGLWNVTTFETEMEGAPFTGIEIMGYDTAKEKFVSVWVDSMSTTLSVMEGTYDAASKTLTMKGESVGMDGEVAEMTNVTEYTDDTMAFTMSMAGPEGAAMPMMTIEYTRKK